MIVPRIANPMNGLLYCPPSQSDTPTPITSCTHTATRGDLHRGWTWASALGSSRMRPIEKSVRVAAFDPAFEFAIAEFAIARNTSTQPAPHAIRARPSHGLPPWKAGNAAKRAGPKNAVAAYVART